MWQTFWIVLFFVTFAAFCIVSALIAWKGIDDLRQLFDRLRRAREQRGR